MKNKVIKTMFCIGLSTFSFTFNLYSGQNATENKSSVKEMEKLQKDDFTYSTIVQGFALAIKLEKQAFTINEPVYGVVRIKNFSTQQLSLVVTDDKRQYLFSVTDLAGNDIPKLEFQKQLESGPEIILRSVSREIIPEAYLEYKFNLATRYDLSKSGKYIVQCRRNVNQYIVAIPKGVCGIVYSNKVEFSIK